MTQPLGADSPFQADVRTFLGIVVSFLIGAVATAAGVGGGAIYIPLFNALVGFALKPSTALSQACITASSLAALTTNLPRRHPTVTEAPLIDFPLMLMLTPLLLVGVGIGVLLNVALPSWLLNILLLVLLMLLLSQAVAKGRALWVQETKRAQALAEAAARHDIGAELLSASARGPEPANANGTGIREALLVGTHHCSLNHQALAAAAPAGLPGLRINRGHSYSCPRGPWALEHDQDAPYNYPEALEHHVAGAVSRDHVHRSRGVSGGGSSVGAARRRTDDAMWDCMDGVNPAGDDDARCETPSSSVSVPPCAFPFAIPRVPSSNGADDVSGAGHLRSGLLGASPRGESPRGQSPASSIYAASWKAFNELGALEFETDLEGDSDFEGVAHAGSAIGRHMRSNRTSGFGSGTASPVLFPPSSYILSQLPRRLLPAQMQLSSATRSPHTAVGRRTTRRRSLDQTTGADLPAAAAVVMDEETGPAGDNWLQRRSKWRNRTGHHHGDGGGGDTDGGGAGLDEPLLGVQGEVMDRPHGAIPDPRAEYGGGAAAPGLATAAGGDPGGGGFTSADPYKPPMRLETLLEEADDRVEGGQSGDGAGPRLTPAAPELKLPCTAGSTTAACSAQMQALPTSQPAADWDPLQLPCQQRAEAGGAMLCDRHNGNGFLGGDVAADTMMLTRSSGRPIGYVYIECMSDVGPERQHLGGWCCSGMSLQAVFREWADGWAATFRRIPRRFAGCLIGAWVVYLALQGARAFQPKCSPAYWALFAIQTAAMLAISGGAMAMAANVLAKHTKAAESSNDSTSIEDREAAIGDIEDRSGNARWRQQQHGHAEEKEGNRGEEVLSAAVGIEPALQCTAALLVLQSPLTAFFATFIAGLTGGLLGLGGGMVMGPVLLQIGVQPQVTAASSGTMVLFSSSAALIQFALLHRLNGPYAGAFAAASLAAGLVGTHAVARAIKRSGRPSIVVLALAGVMAVAMVCVAAFGLRQAAIELRTGELDFEGVCTTGGGK